MRVAVSKRLLREQHPPSTAASEWAEWASQVPESLMDTHVSTNLRATLAIDHSDLPDAAAIRKRGESIDVECKSLLRTRNAHPTSGICRSRVLGRLCIPIHSQPPICISQTGKAWGGSAPETGWSTCRLRKRCPMQWSSPSLSSAPGDRKAVRIPCSEN